MDECLAALILGADVRLEVHDIRGGDLFLTAASGSSASRAEKEPQRALWRADQPFGLSVREAFPNQAVVSS